MLLAEKQRISVNEYNTELLVNHPINRQRFRKPILIMAGIFFCLLIVNLWIQVLLVKQNQELKICSEAIRTLERESVQVRIEMAKLESFERIQTIAQKELGMRIPGPRDYRCIEAPPSIHQDEPRPYNYASKSTLQNPHLWAKITSWFQGFRTAMAQSNDN